EGLPFWRQAPGKVASSLAPVLLGLAALAQLYRSASGDDRRWWREYLLIFGAALLGGLLVWRSLAFAGALVAVPLGWLLSRALVALRQLQLRPRARQALATAALAAIGSVGAV